MEEGDGGRTRGTRGDKRAGGAEGEGEGDGRRGRGEGGGACRRREALRDVAANTLQVAVRFLQLNALTKLARTKCSDKG